MPPMLLPLLAQAVLSPAHVGMDASFTVPVLVLLVSAVVFGIRLEMRQHSQGKDMERQEKRLDKQEGNIEALDARVVTVEQEQAVQAVTLGRIEGGVTRIEQRLDAAIAHGAAGRQSGT